MRFVICFGLVATSAAAWAYAHDLPPVTYASTESPARSAELVLNFGFDGQESVPFERFERVELDAPGLPFVQRPLPRFNSEGLTVAYVRTLVGPEAAILQVGEDGWFPAWIARSVPNNPCLVDVEFRGDELVEISYRLGHDGLCEVLDIRELRVGDHFDAHYVVHRPLFPSAVELFTPVWPYSVHRPGSGDMISK